MSTKMKISIWIVVVILVGGGAVLFRERSSASNSLDLASLNTNDATAYRYELLARYYATHPAGTLEMRARNNAGYPSPAGVSQLAARINSIIPWPAFDRLSEAYAAPVSNSAANKTINILVNPWPAYDRLSAGKDLSTLSMDDATTYRWLAIARYYAEHPNAVR